MSHTASPFLIYNGARDNGVVGRGRVLEDDYIPYVVDWVVVAVNGSGLCLSKRQYALLREEFREWCTNDGIFERLLDDAELVRARSCRRHCECSSIDERLYETCFESVVR
jgi:hypothetical protein